MRWASARACGPPGSTHVTWSGVLDDDWAEGSDAGDATDIPASMGRVDFDNVEVATAASIAGGRLPEVLGMLAIVMESDATPFDAVRAKTNELRGVMEEKLRGLVEQRNINPANPAASIGDAIASARAQLQPSILEALGLWLSSFGDPDDVVGAQTWFFAAADAGVSAGAGLPALAEQAITAELGSNGRQRQLQYLAFIRRSTGEHDWQVVVQATRTQDRRSDPSSRLARGRRPTLPGPPMPRHVAGPSNAETCRERRLRSPPGPV